MSLNNVVPLKILEDRIKQEELAPLEYTAWLKSQLDYTRDWYYARRIEVMTEEKPECS